MKRGTSLLSEVLPMQVAHAKRDGLLIRPLSAGIPPSAESADKLCAIQFHHAQAFATAEWHLLRDGRNGSLQFRETHDSAFLIDSSKEMKENSHLPAAFKNPEHLAQLRTLLNSMDLGVSEITVNDAYFSLTYGILRKLNIRRASARGGSTPGSPPPGAMKYASLREIDLSKSERPRSLVAVGFHSGEVRTAGPPARATSFRDICIVSNRRVSPSKGMPPVAYCIPGIEQMTVGS